MSKKEQVEKIIEYYRDRLPEAVKEHKDKILIGKFLEVLTHQALSSNGYLVYDFPTKEGERGMDGKAVLDHFKNHLLISVECMNGKYDYTEKYFKHLKRRIENACIRGEFPIIICVSKEINFKRFTGKLPPKVKIVELGKQYHPNTTTCKDFLNLQKSIKEVVNGITKKERAVELAEWKEIRRRRAKEREENEILDELLLERHEKELEKVCSGEVFEGEPVVIIWVKEGDEE